MFRIFKNNKNNTSNDQAGQLDDDYIQMEFSTEPIPEPEPELEFEFEPESEDELNSDFEINSDNNSTEEDILNTLEDNQHENNSDKNLNFDLEFQKILEEVSNAKNKTIKNSIMISTIISSLFVTSAITGYHLLSSKNSNYTTEIVVNGEGKTTNIYKAVAQKGTPSVVGITTLTIDTNNFFNLPMQSEGVGSGVVIDKNGYILTNSHVIDDGNATKVSVIFADGTSSNGKILWNDSTLDLAIIKVDKKNLDVAELGDSDKVEVGDLAIAIGNPIGLELKKSVTQGIISGKDRALTTTKGSMTGLLQTDASINPGNSGGPLLNDKGQVIGINTAKLSDTEGLGFAIPINVAKPILEQIINKGNFEKVSMGIKGVDVSNVKAYLGVDLSVESGVYIIEVSNNSPAFNAGLRTGDVITSIDDNNITSMSDLNKELYSYRKGDSAKLRVIRDGKEGFVSINFSKQNPIIKTTPETESDTTFNEDNLINDSSFNSDEKQNAEINKNN